MTEFDTLWYMYLTGIIGAGEYLRRRHPYPRLHRGFLVQIAYELLDGYEPPF